MSILVMTQVWAHSKADGSALLCALAIADFANDDGEAFPSIATLAKKCRVSERSVQYAINRLVDLGELEVERQAGRKGSNLYRIRVQVLRGGGADSAGGVQNPTGGGATGCTQTVNRTVIKRNNKEERARVRVDPIHDGLVVDDKLIEEWSAAFPAIDVTVEIKRAEMWLKANPSNRKSNYERFLFNWLTRAQDRAPRIAAAPMPYSATRRMAAPAMSKEERDAEAMRLLGFADATVIDAEGP